MVKEKGKRRYIDVNIKRELELYLLEALELPEVQKGLAMANKDMKPSSLGVWIIEQFLIDNTSFRLKHFNTFRDHVTVEDKKLRLWIDVAIKPVGESEFEFLCPKCEDNNCIHINFLVTKRPETIKEIEKHGLKYREPED